MLTAEGGPEKTLVRYFVRTVMIQTGTQTKTEILKALFASIFNTNDGDEVSFYDMVTHIVDQGKPTDVIFLNFCNAINTASRNILLDKMCSIQINTYYNG